jgi:hypothetical protein
MRRITLALVLVTANLVGCASSREVLPLAFSEADAPREPTPSSNWSLPANRAAEILRSAPYEIHGVQGAAGHPG